MSRKEGKKSGDPIVGGKSEAEGKPWGHGQYANMPQETRMQEYPKMAYKQTDLIDDTAGRIQSDSKQVERGFRNGLERGMY